MWDPNRRSAPKANSAAASGGKAISTKIEVTKVFQVNTGILHMVIPGARMVRMVVMKLTPPKIVPKPLIARPKTQRSPPRPGEKVDVESGT